MNATEQRNPRTMHFDREDTLTMCRLMNDENRRSVDAVEEALPQIAKAVDAVTAAFEAGGRLIYVGAGTSGRIATADAAECPPTFGADYEQVQAILAGGERVMLRAAEGEEDSATQGRDDLLAKNITANDVVMGISASGNAAYVVSALETAKAHGCTTVSLSSNPDTKIGQVADIVIVTPTGPEVITGSTRLKAGNAQKMVLNMITTCAMTKTGKVYENLMINLRPTNVKLRRRVIGIVQDICGIDETAAEALLNAHGFNIRAAVEAYKVEK